MNEPKTRLVFIELHMFDGKAVCDYLNSHDLADYVLSLHPTPELGLTQCILRVPIEMQIS